MSTGTSIDDELAAHLRRTLAAVAATVTDEPGAVPRAPAPLAGRGPERHSGSRRVVAAVASAAAAMVVVAAGIASLAVADREQADEATGNLVDRPVAGGWLVPSWLPAGVEPWGVTWNGPSASASGEVSWQLFGDPSAGRAVYVELAGYDPDRPPPPPADAEPVTVRGVDGWAAVTTDVAEENPVDSITWRERGVQVTARYKGATRAAVLAALDRLEARSSAGTAGFDPGDGALPLVGEAGATGPGTQLLYSEGAPTSGSPALSITTTAAGGHSIAYLDAWFYRGGDAVGDGTTPVYRTDPGSLLAAWPDGRTVFVATVNGDAVDGATLRRIADSAATTDRAALEALRSAAAANVETLPELAAVSAGVGTYEVHGAGDFRAICLRLPGATGLDCGDVATMPGWHAANSWLVDGTWHVAMEAASDEAGLYGDRGATYRDDPLDAATASSDGLTILFLAPPDDVDEVVADPADDGHSGIFSIPRPT